MSKNKPNKTVFVKAHINAGKEVPAYERSTQEVLSLFDDLFNDPLSPTINNRDLKIKYMYEHKNNPQVLKNLFDQSKTDHQILAYITMTTQDINLLLHIVETSSLNVYKYEANNRIKQLRSLKQTNRSK